MFVPEDCGNVPDCVLSLISMLSTRPQQCCCILTIIFAPNTAAKVSGLTWFQLYTHIIRAGRNHACVINVGWNVRTCRASFTGWEWLECVLLLSISIKEWILSPYCPAFSSVEENPHSRQALHFWARLKVGTPCFHWIILYSAALSKSYSAFMS